MRAAWSAFKLIYSVSRILVRFFLGRNGVLSGERKTDATFLRPATRSLDPSGTALRWEKLPGWQRLLWRLGGLYSLLLLSLSGVLWTASKLLTLPPYLRPSFVLLAHGAIAALLLSVYLLRRHAERYGYAVILPIPERGEEGVVWQRREILRKLGRLEWEKEKVLPVAGIVSTTLGVSLPLLADRRRAVSIPRDFRDGGAIIISLPADFAGVTEKLQTSLESRVAAKLGMRGGLSSSLQLEGSAPRILLRAPEELPELVTWEVAERYLLAAEEYNPLYGVTSSGEWLNISMGGDSPHTGVSAGSGAGKSEMIKVIAMQAMRWGWNVIVLDWKEESQEWIKGMDGVRYVSDIEAIHDMGVLLSEEVEDRKANPHAKRPKVLVICEEWSLTADLLSDYWSLMRSTAEPNEKRNMPVRSPALTGFKKIIYTGRALGMFEMLVAIRFSARVTGGNADLRESFQVILMARYKSQTVKMLAPGIKPFPANRPKERGRWVAVMGDEAVVFRAPLITDEQARKFASGGVPPAASPFVVTGGLAPASWPSIASTLGDDVGPGPTRPNQDALPVLEGEAVEIKPRKLSEMIEDLRDTVDPKITLNILQKAAKSTDAGFPMALGGSPNRGWTYDPEAVRMWTRKRYAAKEIKR